MFSKYSVNEVSFWLHCQFTILIMTMKTPEDFGWNALHQMNSLYGTLCERNITLWGRNEIFQEWKKPFGNGTKWFENGTLKGVIVRFRVCNKFTTEIINIEKYPKWYYYKMVQLLSGNVKHYSIIRLHN